MKAYQEGNNAQRPHQEMGYRTPAEVYTGTMESATTGMLEYPQPEEEVGFHLILTPSLS